MYKKIFSLLLVFCLSLSCFSVVFATDQESDSSDSGSVASDVVTIPQGVYLDQDVYELDNNLRSLASTLSASSPYTADDIYVLLQSCISSDRFKVYDASAVGQLQAIVANTQYNGYSIADYVQRIESSNTTYYSSMEGLLLDIAKGLGLLDFDPSSDVSFSTILTLCYGRLDTINSILNGSNGISSIDNRLNSVNTNLSNIISINTSTYSLLSQFKDGVGSLLGGIDNTLDDIHEYTSESMFSLSHIDSDFHSYIDWIDEYFYFDSTTQTIDVLKYYFSEYGDGSVYSYPFINNTLNNNGAPWYFPLIPLDFIKNYPTFDLIFTFNNKDFDIALNRSVYFPFSGQYMFYNLNGSQLTKIGYQIIPISFPIELVDNQVIIHFDFSSVQFSFDSQFLRPYSNIDFSTFTFTPNSLINANVSCSISFVSSSRLSYFDFYKSIFEHIDSDFHSQLDILNRFKDLYASDDLVQAKEEQQDFESSAIENFTGEGPNAASLSDLGDMSGIGSIVGGTVNSGYSASDATTILNPSGTSFRFFTQDVFNDLNGVNNGLNSTNNTQTRGNLKSSNDDYIVDFIQYRDESLESLKGSGKW